VTDEILVKPRLRGVLHEWGFYVAVIAGAALILLAPAGEARIAVSIYVLGLAGLLGTSALYHRVTWKRPNVRRWMRRLDHSMIFVLIAGTYTPFALLVFSPTLGTTLLVLAWAGAIGGVILSLVWPDAPKWVSAVVYIALGWVAIIGLPEMLEAVPVATVLVCAGGVLYTLGAIVYARNRPNPVPGVFGYHELFHALVLAAAVAHFTAIALVV
jgi:hemolysin III